MPTTYRILGQSAPLATAETLLYAVPAATSAIVSALSICNRSGVAVTFRISASPAGAATTDADYLYFDADISANASLSLKPGIALAATDVVRVYASTADLSFSLFGVELS